MERRCQGFEGITDGVIDERMLTVQGFQVEQNRFAAWVLTDQCEKGSLHQDTSVGGGFRQAVREGRRGRLVCGADGFVKAIGMCRRRDGRCWLRVVDG